MTTSEQRAWDGLRLLRDEGVHVVRQHKIGRYTVDFAIRKQRLAIEIDGGVHNFPGRPEYDAMRQAHLENKGWCFVRFSTEETFDASHMLCAVLAALPPSPSRGGGRGWGEAPTVEDTAHVRPSTFEVETRTTNTSASPHPPTPSPQGEGES